MLKTSASLSLKCMSTFMPLVCNYLLDESPALENLRRINFDALSQAVGESPAAAPMQQKQAA